jgi:hypothetical protein
VINFAVGGDSELFYVGSDSIDIDRDAIEEKLLPARYRHLLTNKAAQRRGWLEGGKLEAVADSGFAPDYTKLRAKKAVEIIERGRGLFFG